MVNSVVFDSSALLAYLNAEPGADLVARLLRGALICSVNACEVATKLFEKGNTAEVVRLVLARTGIRIVDLDGDLAIDAGALRTRTRPFGLSLGDRACLALAARLGARVLTADRAWKDLDIGVTIELVR